MSICTATQKQIADALELGMPLGSVADYVMLSVDEIQREMHGDPAFKAAVNKAIAECMHKRLTKLDKLDNWQALAFILESIWPKRFGRHSRRGRRGKKPSLQGDLDFNYLSAEEQDHLDYLLAKAHGRTGQERGGAGVSIEHAAKPRLLP